MENQQNPADGANSGFEPNSSPLVAVPVDKAPMFSAGSRLGKIRASLGSVRVVIFVVLGLLVIAGGAYAFKIGSDQRANRIATQPSDNFGVQDIELKGLTDPNSLGLSTFQSLSINGQLRVNNSLIITPGNQPKQGTAGQIYYDKDGNFLSYYDGQQFLSLANSEDVATLQNQLDELFSNLSVSERSISPEDIATQSGDNVFTGSNVFDGGLESSDLTVTDTAILQGGLSVEGTTDIADLNVSGTTALGATTASSLVLSSPLDVGSGGTGTSSFASNGILIGQGSSPLSTVNAAGPGLCLVSTAGAPAFQACPGGGGGVDSLNGLTGSLAIANASGAGTTITIDDATTAAKGIASFNATNFSVSAGAVNTIQNIAVTSAPTFAGLTLNGNLSIGGNSIVTSGSTISSVELDVLDGGISEGEVTGVITDVTAGNGLTGGAASGNATVNIASANGGIVVNADNIALTLQPAGDGLSATTSSGSGLEVLTGGLSLLQGCSDGQVLKWNETSDTWGCAADAGGSGVGDDVTVNGLNADGANFINTVASGSSAGLTWNLNTTPSPDDISISISNASATEAGVVTTGVQSFAGDKTFSNAVTVTGLFTANGNVTIETGDTFTFNGDAFTDLSGTGLVVAGGVLQAALGTSIESSEITDLTITGADIANDTITDTQLAFNTGQHLTVTSTPTFAGITLNGNLDLGTNSIVTSGATISSTELDVLDGGITEGEVTGVITDVTAGNGLTGGAASGNATVNIASANGAIVVNADNIALTLQPTGDALSSTTSSGSGLEVLSTGLSLLQGCSDSQILKWNEATDTWGCADDAGGAGVGDDISVNGAGATNANFINTLASGTTAGVSWVLNTTPSPDDISITISNASAIEAGVVTTGVQSFAGDKTFSNAITVTGLFTANGGVTVEAGDTLTFNNDAFTDLSGTGLVVVGGVLQASLGTSIDSSEIDDLTVTGADIANDTIALGTKTTGNYVAGNTGGTGIAVTGSAGEGWSPTISLDYSADLTTNSLGVNQSSFAATGILFEGATADAFETLFTLVDPTADNTITIPNASGTICLSTGNCAGAGSGVTTSGGTTNRLAKFTGAQAINDSTITDDGTNVTTSVDMIIQGGDVTLGTNAQLGSFILNDGNGQTTTLRAGDSAGNLTFILPTSAGSQFQCLKYDTAGQLIWDDCDGGSGGGSGVTALNGLSGAVTIQGNDQIGVSATSPNINLSINGDSIGDAQLAFNTGQHLTVSSTPTFAGLIITGNTTANRPGSPSEGQLYYDTDTDKLLVYSNGKWQADRAESVIVAASNSSQADKDAADYVADGNGGGAGDGDQVQINAALTAATGKKVVLLAGTYTVDANITVPSNTTLAGMGQGTVVTIPNSFNAAINIISISGTDTVVEGIMVDQNTANQTSGTIVGISSTGSNNTVKKTKHINVRSTGIAMSAGSEAMAGVVQNNLVDCTNGDPGASSSALGISITGSTTDNTSSSTAHGNNISNCGTGIRGQSRVVIADNTVMAGRTNGIDLQSVRGATVSGNTVSMLHGNFSNSMGTYALVGTTITNSTIVNNTFSSGFSMVSLTTFNSSTFTGNTMDDSANLMLYINGGSNSTVSGNVGSDSTGNQNRFLLNSLTNSVVSSNTIAQIYLDSASHYDQVVSNQISATGVTSSNMLQINGDNTTASDNVFSGVGSGLVALNVTASADSTYLGGNRMVNSAGATFISDVGTNTIYGGQANDSGNFIVQPAGTIELMKNTNITGTLNVTSNVDTNGSLTVGSADQFVVSNLGVVTAGAWQGTAINDTYVADTLTVDSSSTVDWQALNNYPAACGAGQAVTQLGDSITCQAFAASTGSGSYIQNQFASAQTTADFWVSGTGRADTALQAPTFDTSGATTLTLGGNATSISVVDDVTIAAGKSLTVTGGTTGTRPASPTEGMVYYDTDTDKLLVYSNGKWQADRASVTKTVAPSNAPQHIKDAADYVADGTGDQVEVNAALTAAAGGKVYLFEGTFTVSASISVPNNTTLAGAGAGTLITLPDNHNAGISLITNTDSTTGTNVVIRDLRLDGNKANQASGVMRGISMNTIGGGSGASTRQGATITHVQANNFTEIGIYFQAGAHNTITGNSAQGNSSIGFSFSGNYDTIVDNAAHGNTTYGFYLASDNSVVDGNTAEGNPHGFYLEGATDNTITGNSAISNTNRGFSLAGGSNNNTLTGNIGSANLTVNFYLTASSGNTLTGNTSTAGGTGFSLNASSNNNTLTGNTSTAGGTGFSLSSSSRNTLTGNTAQGHSSIGFYLNGSSDNAVSGNKAHDNGGATANNAIFLSGADNNTITGNSITDTSATTTNYAIDVSDIGSDANYLADNSLGGGSIRDLSDGTGGFTIYGGQVNSSGNFIVQPAGTIELMKNTNVTGTLNVTSNVDTNGSLTVGNADQFVVSNLGVVTAGTWQGTAINDTYVADTLTVNSSSTVDWQALNNYPAACGAGQAVTQLGDSITCQAFASSTGSGSYIQNQFASAQATADFWISGNGRVDGILQTAALDTASAVALEIGTTNATLINLNKHVIVASDQVLLLSGGNTASRQGTAQPGMVYFDTDTQKLIVYSNGKWQADRSDAILVAASNSTQAEKDAADYVADGNTGVAADGDQVEINQALTAAAGKKVVLLAGTYVADATILLPNNTTLAGVGQGTLLELADLDVADNLIENSDTSTGASVAIRDLSLNGRKDLNTAGTQRGIYMNGMGDATTARQGAKITNVKAINFRHTGIYLNNSDNTTILGSRTQGNNEGILLNASTHNTISGGSSDGDDYGITLEPGSTNNSIANNAIQNSGNIGIYIWNTANHNTITGNTTSNSGDTGILAFGSASNTISGNTSHSNGSYGVSINGGVTSTAITGNTTYSNTTAGIYIADSTTTGNSITSNTTRQEYIGVYLDDAPNNSIATNTINDSLDIGILLSGGNGNSVTDNRIHNSGGATINDAIVLQFSDTNTITGNTITDTSATSNNYAIRINDAGSATNYLGGNTLGTGSISDLGTGTIYGGQVNSSGNFIIQPAGTVELMKNTNVTGALNVTGNVDTNGSLTVGNADQFVVSNLGVVTAGTWQGTAINDTYVADTLTVNSSSTVDWQALSNYPAACGAGQAVTQLGDSITCSAFLSGTAASYIQNQFAGAQATTDFWISGTGRADTALQAPTFDTSGATTLTLGGNATSISVVDDVTLAAGKSLTVTGGITGTRPASPTEGMIYFDTTTKQLLTYANGKWQADRSTSTKIIAPSNASQAAKDSADVVLTGTADQTLINTALTAAAGGKVYILEGTVTVTGAISVPNNTTLAGAGAGTLITIPNSLNAAINAITNTSTGGSGAGITIRDLRLDGNRTNQTSGVMRGVFLNGAGTGTGASASIGGRIINVQANSWRSQGFFLSSSSNSTLKGNTAQDNGSHGFSLTSSSNNTLTENIAGGNVSSGFSLATSSSNNILTGNVAQSNTDNGFLLSSSSNNTLTSNTSQSNTNFGFRVESSSNNVLTSNTTQNNVNGIYLLSSSSNNTLTSNTIQDNSVYGIILSSSLSNLVSNNSIVNSGGSTDNNGIYLANSDSNQITDNAISDSSATTTNYAINISSSTSDTNYFAGNSLGTGSINDLGTGTIFGGQVNSSGNFILQPTGTIELMKNTNVTGTLNVTSNVDTNGSLTVGNANQFVINNTGAVTSGTWQGSTIALAYGGTNNTTYTTNGIVYSNGSALVSTAAGTTGQCLLATTGSAPTWGTCTATNLQGTYDASSPATINLTNSKDFTINAADTATDSSIVFNLQCATCSADGGRFAIQDAGVDIFRVNPNGDIIIGTAANNMMLTAGNGYKPTLSGTARNSKKIRLHAEYPSVVLAADGLNNTGTMTSGYDSAARMNYYNWTTTQGSNQDYDIVIQVPLPSDFSAWDGANPLAVTAYTSNTTNGTIAIEARDSADAQICNFVSVTPGSTGTWATNNTACTLSTGTYTAGDYITLRIRLQAPTSGNTRVGNITLNYLSRF